jgi:hypothetical protein
MGELLGGVGLGLAVAVQVGPQVLTERVRARRLAAVSAARRWDREAGRMARADVDAPRVRVLPAPPVEVLDLGPAAVASFRRTEELDREVAWLLRRRAVEDLGEGREVS